MSASNGAAPAHLGAARLDEILHAAEVVVPSRGGESAGNRTSNTLITSGGHAVDETPVAAEPEPGPPDPSAYHGLAGEIVRAIEPHTEADPVGLLVQFLVLFGNMIGRSAHFVAEGADHHMNLFTVMVGRTGKGRKGSSYAQIKRVLESIDPDWARKRIQSGLSSGEGLIWAVRDPIEKDEPVKDAKTKEVTGYQKVMTDVGVEDKRLMVFQAEFATVTKVMAREGNTLSDLIRLAWDTGSLRSMTKNTPAQATGAHISVIGHITRDEAREYINRTEMGNGFVNRFLLAFVKRSKLLPHGGEISSVDFGPTLGRLSQASKFAKQCKRMTRDAEADALWAEAYPLLSEGRPGLLGAVLGRAEAQVMRLACVYALLDRSAVVRPPHLLAALALWRYCEESARYTFGSSLGDRDLDTLWDAIRARPGGLTRTEIFVDVFQKNKNAAYIRQLLGRLLEYGMVRREADERDGAGRPAERWRAALPPTQKT